MKRILSILFIFLILFGISPVDLCADETTYTVQFDGGRYGTITGDSGSKLDCIPFNSTYYLNGNTATIVFPDRSIHEFTLNKTNDPNNKYYFKGFHISGQVDSLYTTLNINKDLILVGTYGVANSLTEYRVRYIDEDGNEILPTDTMYANEGDQPIVGCRYKAGYIPNVAMMQSEPLRKGVVQVFTFIYRWYGQDDVYIPLEPVVVYVYPTRTTVKPDTTTDEGTEVIEEIVYEPEPQPAPAPAPAPAPEPEPEPEEKTILETIGDMIAPLTNWINDTLHTNPVLGVAAIAGLAAIGIGIIFLLVFLFMLLFKRRKKDEEEQPQQS